jgi:hypothetical protein
MLTKSIYILKSYISCIDPATFEQSEVKFMEILEFVFKMKRKRAYLISR